LILITATSTLPLVVERALADAIDEISRDVNLDSRAKLDILTSNLHNICSQRMQMLDSIIKTKEDLIIRSITARIDFLEG